MAIWRADIAVFKFTEKIINGDPIDVLMRQSSKISYISDIVALQ